MTESLPELYTTEIPPTPELGNDPTKINKELFEAAMKEVSHVSTLES